MPITAPPIIQQLVDTFEQNLDSYHSRKNETELRREFLDKFFAALGWDVTNEKGLPEDKKEVVHEFSVEVQGQGKKADYAFRAGNAKGEKFDFLVEAKKPSVKVESSIDAAFQVRRYGWSAKLPLNILTDFEHFAIYDCRAKPIYGDSANIGRNKIIHYKEFVQRWDEIASVFSFEAVSSGSFASYAENMKGKKGTIDVDDAFLEEIERWRDLLARNIALRNKEIDIAGLNYAVQMTIDRIIFLRICEEREIEPENQLLDIANKSGAYQELCALFKRADTKYNSGLFHFKAEKGQSSHADDLTLSLNIDDKVLKDIISNLYYPKSPYAFLYIPADILGQVYERFLGKVIRLTAGHQAKVEEKPEVRKAGGVYYTPTYIVEYIVKNTIGKLVEGKKPEAVAKLKVVDPACGSGSFLLGAYQFLLDWHLDWYSADDPEKWVKNKVLTPASIVNPTPAPGALQPDAGLFRPRDVSGEAGRGRSYRLTTAKKKEILLNNIHGVDIDAQAVEVTKLSLLLKVLENASGQLGLGLERVLPDLGENIKCGNSLIGFDYFEGQLFPDEAERTRVNPFDWRNEFKDVFAKGGFDAVIGNPPYIRIQAMQEWASGQVEFFKQKYKAATKGNYDIYVVFIEKGLGLLNEKGKLGFILPHKFFNAQYGEPIRDLVSQGKNISKIVHFGDQQIFESATTYTCLLFLDGQSQSEFEFTKISDLASWRSQISETFETSENSGIISVDNVTSAEWNFSTGKGAELFEKLGQMPIKLGDVAARMAQGIRTSANEIYVVDFVANSENFITAHSKQLDKNVELEKGLLSSFLQGREIKRYKILSSGKSVIIPYELINSRTTFIPINTMKDKYPKTIAYLLENKSFLENREKGKMRGATWYGYVYPKNIEFMKQKKILIPDIADRAQFALDENGEYSFTSGYGITLKEDVMLSYQYILGLLNSKVLNFYLKRISTPMQNGFFRYFTQFIEQLPIRTIDFTKPAEKAQHDKMVHLVEQMLALHKAQPVAKTPQEKERLTRQIEATDRAIDELVYKLYGLSEEEIKIVEGK